jgi:hypothetical protein
LAATLLVMIAFAASSQAVTINITDAHPQKTATKTGCCPTECPECKVTAYKLVGTFETGADVKFTSAFDSWNDEPGDAKGWTLTDGGALTGTFNVSKYDAGFSGCSGGVEIRVSYVPGAGDPTGADVAWAQSIDTNVKKAGAEGPGNPYLDIKTSATTEDPPAYPFQYADKHFYDFPKRECPGECGALTSWEGRAFLSEVDYTNKELTVYQGINWGFNIECTTPPPLVVDIDYITGEVILEATVDIELIQLQLTSVGGGLIPQTPSSSAKILEFVGHSDDFVYGEGASGPHFLPIGEYPMGMLYDAAMDSQDVDVSFVGPAGEEIDAEVRYTPEPMTMSVLAMGTLMLIRRKRRTE